MTSAIEIAERLARQAKENQRKQPQIDAGDAQSTSGTLPHTKTKQNAPQVDLTPHDIYHIVPAIGNDPINVFFHPPLTVAAVRQHFYKNATTITPIQNI